MIIQPKTLSIPNIVVGTLETPDLLMNIRKSIEEQILQPNSFVILDFGQAPEHFIDILGIKRELKNDGIYIAALRNVKNETTHSKAFVAGIGILPDTPDTPIASDPALETVIVRKNHRSGQQAYYQSKNVVIIGNVSNGAEIIADGSITVYGAANGKLIAGANGLDSAFVFAGKANPEIVSINGTFITSESINEDYRDKQVLFTKAQSKVTMEVINNNQQ